MPRQIGGIQIGAARTVAWGGIREDDPSPRWMSCRLMRSESFGVKIFFTSR